MQRKVHTQYQFKQISHFPLKSQIEAIAASNFTLTILPPYTIEERFNTFVNTWITPITGVWTFLAGVAAVLAPVILRIYKNKKNQ